MKIVVKGSEVAKKPLAHIIIGNGYTELILLYSGLGVSIDLSTDLDMPSTY